MRWLTGRGAGRSGCGCCGRAVVYFVLGLCLLSSEDSMGPPGYRWVMRSLTHGVRHLAGLAVPSGRRCAGPAAAGV